MSVKSPLDFYDKWGAASEAMQRDELGGVEKRLECDFKEEYTGDLDWQSVLETLGLGVRGAMVSVNVSCFLCDRAIVIVMAQKIIITAAHHVAIHEFVGPLVDMLKAAGIIVDWASFMKKSTASPWQTKDQTLALEYAHLKSTFPSGNPFIFGQLDGDHYFYFVTDTIERLPTMAMYAAAAPKPTSWVKKVEADVQVNLIMYNVDDKHLGRPHELFGREATCVYRLELKEFQGAWFHGTTYEHLRVVRNPGTAESTAAGAPTSGRLVSFETNAELTSAGKQRLTDLVAALKPERFTALVLLDPESETAKDLAVHNFALEVGEFPGHSVVNRTMNEFEAGYFVLKVSYALEAHPTAALSRPPVPPEPR